MMYPIMLKLTDRKILVIGGGEVAARKVGLLTEAGGRPTIVSPVLTPVLQTLVKTYQLPVHQRCYQAGDCKNYFLVFHCSNDPQLSQQLVKEVGPNQLYNDAANKDHSNFYNMATFMHEEVQVAVSSHGQSPAKMKTLKQKLLTWLIKEDAPVKNRVNHL